jgi:diadenylate cyclase
MGLPNFRIQDFVEILILAFVVYRLITQARGTRAVSMFFGVLVLVAFAVIAAVARLETINWFVDRVAAVWVLALLIVFQPEVRRLLSNLGRNRLVRLFIGVRERVIDTVIRVVAEFSRDRVGALVIFERDVPLGDFAERGVRLNSDVNAEILWAVFEKKSPLHDGAVIIEGNIITAAAVMLPLTDNPAVAKSLGARHRAAIGITEVSDALALCVSEDDGTVSLADKGELTLYRDLSALKADVLNRMKGRA